MNQSKEILITEIRLNNIIMVDFQTFSSSRYGPPIQVYEPYIVRSKGGFLGEFLDWPWRLILKL